MGHFGRERNIMACLIRWPAILTHFECKDFNLKESHAMLESMLLIHKETLKYIRIDSRNSPGDTRFFNATLFPRLEFLAVIPVDLWFIASAAQCKATCTNLMGQNLKTFACCFESLDDTRSNNRPYCESVALFLGALAEIAVSCKAPLKTVKVYMATFRMYQETYPWKGLDEARDRVMKPRGLDLVCGEPHLSLDEWQRYRISRYVPKGPTIEEWSPESSRAQLIGTDDQDTDHDTNEYMDELQRQTGYERQDIRKYFAAKIEA